MESKVLAKFWIHTSNSLATEVLRELNGKLDEYPISVVASSCFNRALYREALILVYTHICTSLVMYIGVDNGSVIWDNMLYSGFDLAELKDQDLNDIYSISMHEVKATSLKYKSLILKHDMIKSILEMNKLFGNRVSSLFETKKCCAHVAEHFAIEITKDIIKAIKLEYGKKS